MSATSHDIAEQPSRAADGGHPRGLDAGLAGTSGRRVARVAVAAWAVSAVVVAAWAVGYVTWPFSNDQGNLAWVGDVIRSGGMPYRDAWDVKGPAAHLLFALAGVLGRNEWGLRLFDLLMLSVGAVAIWRIARRHGGPATSRWAVLLYLLWYASLDHHSTAQPDGWAAVLAAAAVATMMTRSDRPDPVAGSVAGALLGVCALIKPTYALLLVLPLLAGVTQLGLASRARVAWFLAASVVGFAVPIASCVVWFDAAGALAAWRDVHLVWIPTSYTELDAAWLNRLQYLASYFTTNRFAPALPLAVGGLVLVRRAPARRDAVVLAAWPVIGSLGVAIQGQFYEYHWHSVYPPLAVLAGIGIQGVLAVARETPGGPRDERAAPGMLVALAAVGVALGGALVQPALHVYRQAKYSAGVMDGRELDRVEFGPYGHHGGVFPEVVAYLRSNSAAADRVLVWGSGAGINYLSGRASPSPFGFVQALVDPPDSELRRRYRADFIRDLTSAPPRYVVSLNEAACAANPSPDSRKLMGRAEGLMRCLRDIPELRTYVLDRYVTERVIGPLEVRRKR